MTRKINSVFLSQALYKTHYLCPNPHCLVVTIVVGPWSTCLLDPSCVSWMTSKQGVGFSHTIYTAIYASPCPPLRLLLQTSFLAIAGVTFLFAWFSLHFLTAPSMLCFIKKLLEHLCFHSCLGEAPLHLPLDPHPSNSFSTSSTSLFSSGGPYYGWNPTLTA